MNEVKPQSKCGIGLRLVKEYDHPDAKKVFCPKKNICGPLGWSETEAIIKWNENDDCTWCMERCTND